MSRRRHDREGQASPTADTVSQNIEGTTRPRAGRAFLRSRSVPVVGLVVGLAFTAWLTVHVGAPAIGAALRAAGWTGLLAISAFHLIAVAAMGIACWRLLLIGSRWTFLWARLVRDAGSEMLPLSQIGGFLLGARAVIGRGYPAAAAGAAMFVDATVEFAAQIAYILFGLALSIWLLPSPPVLALPAIAFAVIATIIALIAMRRRGGKLRRQVSLWLARAWPAIAAARVVEVQAEIGRIYRRKHALWPSFLLHLTAWFLSGAEAWLALRFMGAALEPVVVLAIESMVYAARSVGFLVPSAIGIQEGAYIVAGAAFGLPADLAVGLSLLKRARDLVLGIPALVSWQLVEGRGGWKRRGAAVMNRVEPPLSAVEPVVQASPMLD
jgi:putative membrane protein